MLRIAAEGGNRLHAPGNTIAALVSAHTAGADDLIIDVRCTADDELVAYASNELEPDTGMAMRVSTSTYAELREVDLGARFRVRGGTETPWKKDTRPEARIRRLGALIDELPENASLVLLIHVEKGQNARAMTRKALAVVERRGIESRCVIASAHDDVLQAAESMRRIRVLNEEMDPSDAAASDVDGWLAGPAAILGADGRLTAFAQSIAELYRNGKAQSGVFLRIAEWTETFERVLNGVGAPVTLVVGSVLDVAKQRRSLRALERASFAGTTEDAGRFHFGYAKANGYAHVHQDDGVHIDIRPYDGPTEMDEGLDSIERELAVLRERLMFAERDWPYYSGGGVGTAFALDRDFIAEVDFESTWASQATMLEMAVTNVDPPKHRPGFRLDEKGARVPNVPQSFRDKGCFFDPHGAPPFVGVEHDEDDGFRINHNLGTEYDNNQYGRPLGNGKSLRGRMRLERRGAWFSAYYRDAANPDWVCVGTCRNDSMNRRVFLRCVGKRWRQERDDGSGVLSDSGESHHVPQSRHRRSDTREIVCNNKRITLGESHAAR